MKTLSPTWLLLLLLVACENANAPPDTLSLFAETAEFSLPPQGGYAQITLALRIRNDGAEAVEPWLCTFALQRDTGSPSDFVTVESTACIETSAWGPRVEAHNESLVSLSLPVAVEHVDVTNNYRVVLVFRFGPEFRSTFSYSSASFLFKRE